MAISIVWSKIDKQIINKTNVSINKSFPFFRFSMMKITWEKMELKNSSLVDRGNYFFGKKSGKSDSALTLYHIVPTFNDPKEEGFGKQLGKNEKVLVTSIFSFSHSIFCSIKEKNHHFSNF